MLQSPISFRPNPPNHKTQSKPPSTSPWPSRTQRPTPHPPGPEPRRGSPKLRATSTPRCRQAAPGGGRWPWMTPRRRERQGPAPPRHRGRRWRRRSMLAAWGEETQQRCWSAGRRRWQGGGGAAARQSWRSGPWAAGRGPNRPWMAPCVLLPLNLKARTSAQSLLRRMLFRRGWV